MILSHIHLFFKILIPQTDIISFLSPYGTLYIILLWVVLCCPWLFILQGLLIGLPPVDVNKLSLHCGTSCISGTFCHRFILWGLSFANCVLLHLLIGCLCEVLKEIPVGGGSIRYPAQEQVSNGPWNLRPVIIVKSPLGYDVASTNNITANMFRIGKFSGCVGPIFFGGVGWG